MSTLSDLRAQNTIPEDKRHENEMKIIPTERLVRSQYEKLGNCSDQ